MEDRRTEQAVVIADDWPGYALELFTYPEHYRGDVESVYIPHGIIMNRIECLAKDILENLGHDNLMVLCVLKGGYKFCADLVDSVKAQSRSFDHPITTRVEFIRLKSYLNDRSTEDLHIIGPEDLSVLTGKPRAHIKAWRYGQGRCVEQVHRHHPIWSRKLTNSNKPQKVRTFDTPPTPLPQLRL
ncbi:phosphoribosyltransferase domain-containing protein 1 isoform X1 [Tachysurus ichikawai]